MTYDREAVTSAAAPAIELTKGSGRHPATWPGPKGTTLYAMKITPDGKWAIADVKAKVPEIPAGYLDKGNYEGQPVKFID
jgi:hypothetical protein